MKYEIVFDRNGNIYAASEYNTTHRTQDRTVGCMDESFGATVKLTYPFLGYDSPLLEPNMLYHTSTYKLRL